MMNERGDGVINNAIFNNWLLLIIEINKTFVNINWYYDIKSELIINYFIT